MMNSELKIIHRIEDLLASPQVFDSGNPHPYRMGLIDSLLAIKAESVFSQNRAYISSIIEHYCNDNSDETYSGGAA